MSKTTKINFDRDGSISAIRQRPNTKEILSKVEYENGIIKIKHDGFESTIHKVDKVQMIIKPLDHYISSVSFIIENEDGGKQKLDVKLYGTLTEHIILDYENQEEKSPGDVKKVKID